MIINLTLAGPMRPTRYTKKKIAQAMLLRGSHFLASAILLKKRGAYQYVVLHLLCQGLEIIQKALLLSHDYDKFIKEVSDRKKFGHDLVKGARAITSCYGLRPMKPELEDQLKTLNGYYASHQLRYASATDIFIDPSSIPYDQVMRHAASLVRLGRMKIQTPNLALQPTAATGRG